MNKTIKKDTITLALALVTFMMIMASTQKTLRLLQQLSSEIIQSWAFTVKLFFQAYNYVTSKVMAWILKTQILTEIQGY